MRSPERPVPFLKWAGGKREICAAILALAPREIDTYYEPFVGGGAVFFAMAAERRFARAVLADVNEELIACYQSIRDDVEGVIRALRRHRHDRDHYYRVRERDPAELAPAARAARLIYLNRCGYNGLYRVNSSGQFNVPFGRHKNPAICDEPRLRAAASALAGVTLRVQDFARTMAAATPRDFVYLDPPYVPVSRTSYFTSYARGGFGAEEQERLAAGLRALGERRVPALLSNADAPATRELYGELPCMTVPVRRNINSVAARRGRVAELLVKSFRYDARRDGPACPQPLRA